MLRSIGKQPESESVAQLWHGHLSGIYMVIVISMPAGFRRHLVGKLLEMFVILMSLNYALSVDDHVDILLN